MCFGSKLRGDDFSNIGGGAQPVRRVSTEKDYNSGDFTSDPTTSSVPASSRSMKRSKKQAEDHANLQPYRTNTASSFPPEAQSPTSNHFPEEEAPKKKREPASPFVHSYGLDIVHAIDREESKKAPHNQALNYENEIPSDQPKEKTSWFKTFNKPYEPTAKDLELKAQLDMTPEKARQIVNRQPADPYRGAASIGAFSA